MKNKFKIGGTFYFECYDKNGKLKWKDKAKNTIVNVGLNHILDVVFHNSSQTSTWYIGLTDATPTISANDTMSSHSGWTEIGDYDESTRQTYNEAASSGQSITNAANKATFTIDDTVTVGGAFLSDTTAKIGSPGSASGTLCCVAAFSGGNKAVVVDDILYITYVISAGNS